MTDVFISYAHEDQDAVRRMAQALEAEGLSVWWDHTIPPGKTWNTYIARGIEEAKACIVVWSAHSVKSKWVLEEASLAGDAEKLLPVAVDSSAPPMGFRSIQAAQLQSWLGDRANAQWLMLVREVRALVVAHGGARSPSTPRPAPPPPPPAPRQGAAIAAGVAAVALIAIGAWWLGSNRAPSELAVAATTTTATTPERDQELERLRNESQQADQIRRAAEQETASERAKREQSERFAAEQQAASERARQETARLAAERAAASAQQSVVGTWSGYLKWTDPKYDGTYSFTFRTNGTFICNGAEGSWSQSGSRINWQFYERDSGGQTSYTAVLSGDALTGTMKTRTGHPNGTFTIYRGR